MSDSERKFSKLRYGVVVVPSLLSTLFLGCSTDNQPKIPPSLVPRPGIGREVIPPETKEVAFAEIVVKANGSVQVVDDLPRHLTTDVGIDRMLVYSTEFNNFALTFIRMEFSDRFLSITPSIPDDNLSTAFLPFDPEFSVDRAEERLLQLKRRKDFAMTRGQLFEAGRKFDEYRKAQDVVLSYDLLPFNTDLMYVFGPEYTLLAEPLEFSTTSILKVKFRFVEDQNLN